MSKIGVIIQARMGSTRLPAKSMQKILGEPMLFWAVFRLRRAVHKPKIIIATTKQRADDIIDAWCKDNGLDCFRGDELDVLDRYYQCAQNQKLKHIIRATGDNPLVDPHGVDRLISLHFESNADYSCSFPEFGSGFPKGTGVEIFTISALAKSWKEGVAPHHREHVNEYIHENWSQFKISVLKANHQEYAPSLSLTVDTLSDFDRVNAIYEKYFSLTGEKFVPLEWIVLNQ